MAHIQIIGRVGQDPKGITNGCKISVCENGYNYKKKEKEAHWFNVAMFGKVSETCLQWVRKGQWVAVTGRIEPYEYYKDEEKRHGFNITATDLKMVGGMVKKEEPEAPVTPPAPTLQQSLEMEVTETKKPSNTYNFDDDEIPF